MDRYLTPPYTCLRKKPFSNHVQSNPYVLLPILTAFVHVLLSIEVALLLAIFVFPLHEDVVKVFVC